MPHYKNGAPATAGDLVVHSPSFPNATQTLGIVVNIQPGASCCNAGVIVVARKYAGLGWIPMSSPYTECISLADCARVSEELAVFAKSAPAEASAQSDGDPRPPGAVAP